MLTNPGFKIKVFGTWYEEGFSFINEPSITVKRNYQDRAIYEVPAFDFVATGQLFEDLHTEMINNGVCNNLDIDIAYNDEIRFNGHIKPSAVMVNVAGPDGTFMEVPVIDKNYNTYFKSFGGLDVDISSPFDLDCNIITPPSPQFITLFESDVPITTRDERLLYSAFDVISHIVRIISRDNVTFVSDFFSTGDGSRIFLREPEGISALYPDSSLITSYEAFFNSFWKLENLWSQFYTLGGVQYCRIEPYEFFYGDDIIDLAEVADITLGTKLDRLYATAKLGQVDRSELVAKNDHWLEFEYDTFAKQVVNVGNDCSTEAELNLEAEYVVDTVRINDAFTGPGTILDEDRKVYVIETDGSGAAVEYTDNNLAYYNGRYLNSQILARHFNGLGPITVFPEEFDDLDYFYGEAGDNQSAGTGNFASDISVLGTGENIQIAQLYMWLEDIIRDPNSVLSTDTYNPSMGGTVLILSERTLFTCGIPGNYSFTLDLVFKLTFNVVEGDPVRLRAVLVHTDAGLGIINRYESPYVNMENTPGSQTVKTLTYKTTNINFAAGEKAYVKIECEIFYARAGAIGVYIEPPSSWSVSPCPNFISDLVPGSNKDQIYTAEFSEHFIELDTWEAFRASPADLFRVTSDPFQVRAYCEEVKYSYKTGLASAKLAGNEIYTRV